MEKWGRPRFSESGMSPIELSHGALKIAVSEWYYAYLNPVEVGVVGQVEGVHPHPLLLGLGHAGGV